MGGRPIWRLLNHGRLSHSSLLAPLGVLSALFVGGVLARSDPVQSAALAAHLAVPRDLLADRVRWLRSDLRRKAKALES